MNEDAVSHLIVLLCRMLGVMSLEQTAAGAWLVARLERYRGVLAGLDVKAAVRWLRRLRGIQESVISTGRNLVLAERRARLRLVGEVVVLAGFSRPTGYRGFFRIGFEGRVLACP